MPEVGGQPAFVRRPMSRLSDAIPEFPEHDHRDARSRLMAQDFANGRVAVDKSGQRVGIENQD